MLSSVSLLYAQILAIRDYDSAYAHDSVLFSHGQRPQQKHTYIHTVHTDASSEITLGKLGRTHLLLAFIPGLRLPQARELRLQWQPARAFSSGTMILPLSIRVMMDLRLRLNNHWSVVVRVGEACQ